MRRTLLLIILSVLVVSALPHVSLAQNDPRPDGNGASSGTGISPTSATFVPLADYSKSPALKSALEQKDLLGPYLNNIFTMVLSVGAILAVLRIAYAGYLYMGTDMWSNKGKGKEVLGDAIIGLLLLLSVWLILNQINPNLLKIGINLNGSQSPSSPPQSGANGCFTDACLGNNSASTQGTLNQANPNSGVPQQGGAGTPSGSTITGTRGNVYLTTAGIPTGAWCFKTNRSIDGQKAIASRCFNTENTCNTFNKGGNTIPKKPLNIASESIRNPVIASFPRYCPPTH
jgi:hypothetical protein